MQIRYLLASILVSAIWAAMTLATGGYYDWITWACYGISIVAVEVAFYNYCLLAERVYRGEVGVFNPFEGM